MLNIVYYLHVMGGVVFQPNYTFIKEGDISVSLSLWCLVFGLCSCEDEIYQWTEF